ncbi:fibronectin-binding protein [Mycolicibacterium neoaurum]|uniref:fibronectin-binding protein n=1 Tax=Mycolicibacterium neoaurum TaxID=1795 RepID=UPI002671E486|nr:fibronectin-binding protein [Mycolicibacterium neoaurum]MDO3402955.1 fibronectin-binding protein [Mycolicibacterium neoaurum]
MTRRRPTPPAIRRTSLAGVALVLGYALLPAADGSAQPPDIPCTMAVSIICHFLPIAPDWEGDIDLTVDQPAADPSAPEPDSRTPADYCINGCT